MFYHPSFHDLQDSIRTCELQLQIEYTTDTSHRSSPQTRPQKYQHHNSCTSFHLYWRILDYTAGTWCQFRPAQTRWDIPCMMPSQLMRQHWRDMPYRIPIWLQRRSLLDTSCTSRLLSKRNQPNSQHTRRCFLMLQFLLGTSYTQLHLDRRSCYQGTSDRFQDLQLGRRIPVDTLCTAWSHHRQSRLDTPRMQSDSRWQQIQVDTLSIR